MKKKRKKKKKKRKKDSAIGHAKVAGTARGIPARTPTEIAWHSSFSSSVEELQHEAKHHHKV